MIGRDENPQKRKPDGHLAARGGCVIEVGGTTATHRGRAKEAIRELSFWGNVRFNALGLTTDRLYWRRDPPCGGMSLTEGGERKDSGL